MKRDNDYITVRKARVNKRSVSSPSMGKKTIFFTLGGRGTKLDQGIKVGGKKFWNPGTCIPTKQFK